MIKIITPTPGSRPLTDKEEVISIRVREVLSELIDLKKYVFFLAIGDDVESIMLTNSCVVCCIETLDNILALKDIKHYHPNEGEETN